jgi:hypothetical protein
MREPRRQSRAPSTSRARDDGEHDPAAARAEHPESYLVLPVTVKWARRFRCQQSSLDSWHTGTSLP